MVYLEVELMASTRSCNDISKERIFRPLQKYDIIEAHINRRVPFDYGSVNSYYRPREHSTVEITFDQEGLEKLSVDLYKIQEEEWLRKNNPSLQKAWEHYQTVLGLVK
jgi:hypothetical protein